MMLVVQLRNRLSQRPNTRRRTILSSMSTDVDLLRPLEASFYAVVDFRCTLSQIGPFFRLLQESVLVLSSISIQHRNSTEFGLIYCLLGSPNHTSGGAGGIKAGVGLVAFVGGAKLPVNARAEFCIDVSACDPRKLEYQAIEHPKLEEIVSSFFQGAFVACGA